MSTKTERIHSLDALRAIMMMLGVVFHSAISYCLYDQGDTWPLKDPQTTHIGIDFIVGYIHVFRMPVFFFVAGFFGALLFYERSPLSMMQNRFKRILRPFLVFLMLLWPIIGLSYMFTFEAFNGATPPQAEGGIDLAMLIPQSTFHLWFLEYLMVMSVAVFGLAFLFKRMPKFTQGISAFINKVLANPFLKISMVAVPTFCILYLINMEWVNTANDLIPSWKNMLFYSSFYLFGWILFKSKEHLDTFKQYDWLLYGVSLVLFGITLAYKESMAIELKMALNALTVSICLFSITGLFIRYFSKPSEKMRYVSDASYWVYIFHMPLTMFLPGLFVAFSWSPFIKFLLIMSVTTFLAFVTYHYWVRSTFLGEFLNGRRYPKVSMMEVWRG